ncbi:MAG TPA: MBL fold metallo-hydrolase [Lachnospiraceae bacterium]|nr:MBL fold metallo-hydrolase [Lachnospiraceae bacterium]
MKLTMLGTGNALVTECYNTCFLIEDNGQYLLVDGGGGNTLLSRLKRAGADWKNVRNIIVTHKHIDHILGIVWMMRMILQYMNQGDYEGDAVIYAHAELIELLTALAGQLLKKKEAALIGKRLHMVATADGSSYDIIGHKVTFFDIHSTKAKQYGFTMELENEARAEFQEAGAGSEIHAELHEACADSKIQPEEMKISSFSGERLTCCGDEPYNELEEKYARGSKWLMLEAFCLYGQADIFHPYEKHHSTVKEASELAETLDVKNLILYHTEDRNIKNRKELYTKEGKAYYHGNLCVPEDMETFEL